MDTGCRNTGCAPRPFRHNAGFTLVAVAALLIVASLATATLILKENREAVWSPQMATKDQLEHIGTVLVQFQRKHHRLPCPAPRNQLPDSINFGLEGANCSLGMAINGTTRHAIDGGVYMRVGVLPVRTLGLPEAYNADEWSNRFSYAVIENLTDPYQFSDVNGTLAFTSDSGTNLTDGAYAVVSHGKDSKGAYTLKGGVQVRACSSTAGYDQENCNNDGTFTWRIFVPQEGSTHFDDLLIVKATDAQAKGINTPCYPPRTPALFTWNDPADPAASCSGTFVNMLHGETASIGNSNDDNTGTAEVRCNNGRLEKISGSCEYTRKCLASTETWVGTVTGCSAPRADLKHGDAITLTNSANGRNGSVTVSCSKGVITQSGGTCNGNSCSLPWGAPLVHGSSTTAYAAASVPCGSSCAEQVRACSFGTLSGSYTNKTCTAAACANCSLPWGGTPLAHNSSVTAWAASSVACGSSCASQSRKCTNGTLSGSYTAQSCSVQACASCTLPWGTTIAHNQTATAYSSSSGASCVSQSRQCSNGTLSGSYQHRTCTVTSAPPAPEGSAGTNFNVTAFICDASHPRYSEGVLSTQYKNMIIAAYKGATKAGRCPDGPDEGGANGYTYWQQVWKDRATSYGNPPQDIHFQYFWSCSTQFLKQLCVKYDLVETAKRGGEHTSTAYADGICKNAATKKYGASYRNINAVFVVGSGNKCKVTAATLK